MWKPVVTSLFKRLNVWISICSNRILFYFHRSGSKMLGLSSGGTCCDRKALGWTRPLTAPRCKVVHRRAQHQRSPTPPWAPPAPPLPWQTWPTPPCPLSPPCLPQCRAVWTSTSAGAHHRPRWLASSDGPFTSASSPAPSPSPLLYHAGSKTEYCWLLQT